MPRLQITSPEVQAQLDAAKSVDEMRAICERAACSLKTWEAMAREYEFEDGQACPWCLYKKGLFDDGTPMEHSRNCPFHPGN